MRAARENAWMLDESKTSRNGRVICLNLGADYCAEHEWGVKRLKQSFGIEDNAPEVYGIEKRRIKEIPDTLHYLVEKDKSILTIKEYWQKPDVITLASLKSQELYDRNDLNTAWDERSFGVLVKGEKGQKNLEALYNAFMAKDVAIWLGGGGVFQNAGLCLGIISNMPAANLAEMEKSDKNSHKLKLASEATGIVAKIDKLNKDFLEKEGKRGSIYTPCGYYALSPAWRNDKSKTKYDVIYWLNPQQQQKNNYGWFTVEELEQWMEGKGPIPGKDKKAI